MIPQRGNECFGRRAFERSVFLSFLSPLLAIGLFAANGGIPVTAADGHDHSSDATTSSLPSTAPRRVPRVFMLPGIAPRSAAQPPIQLAGIDTPGDPGFTPSSAADSPTESSGPFDTARSDLGEDDELSTRRSESSAIDGRQERRRLQPNERSPADLFPDPLQNTPKIDPATTGRESEEILAEMLPARTDTFADWVTSAESLHDCGEPRALPACVPGPPCHPSMPSQPYDLVGLRGVPSGGPIYSGPCAPRTGSHDGCHFPHAHPLWDRWFDWFYRWK